jgi:cyclophilin family peptidyl-prolyl cis-trans isomerase
MAYPIVTITMADGSVMKAELYPETAPNTVNNFISLVNAGFYNGLIFHRVINGFMIQGGCPDGTGMGGPGYTIPGEFAMNGFQNTLKHTAGVLSMARAQHPDSAGSQFFIMHKDAPYLDGQYAAFGKIIEGMEGHDHEHEHDEEHDEDHDHDENHEHEHEHEHGEVEYDEHVWLSLRNAQVLVQRISDAMQKIDAANAATYKKNSDSYIESLKSLDNDYKAVVDAASNKTILFGDRFPFRYMVDDYGLTYFAAFAGCSAESEASFETITFLSKKVDELKLPVVLTIEGKDHRIAETIVQNTASKDQKIMTLDSMQSASTADYKGGTTYLSIMKANLSVLTEALK